MKYIILVDKLAGSLAARVNEMLDQGWLLSGPLVAVPTPDMLCGKIEYIHTLVKYEEVSV